MNAGQTDIKIGSRIRITHIASNHPADKALVGIEGKIAHPFIPGLMTQNPHDYVASMYVDPAMAKGKLVADPMGCYQINLMTDDQFEVMTSQAVFSDVQKAVLSVYDDGNILIEEPDDVADCGDGLLKYLMVELSEKEGCDSMEEAQRRVQSSINQLNQVLEHLQSL